MAPDKKIDWIELVLGFSCNLGCRACPSTLQPDAGAMTSKEIARWLSRGRQGGAEGVWFGGGEPTLHPNLLAAARRARELGYQRIRVQTNGMRFADAAYAAKMVEAGLSEVAVAIMGAEKEAHDAFTRDARSFELLVQGIGNLVDQGVRVEGDVLMTAQSAGGLDRAVERFAGLGVCSFCFWLVSLHGLDAARHAHRVPPMAALVPHLQQALKRGSELGVDCATLHTPPCVLPEAHQDKYRHAGTWRLLVITPGAEPFMAEESPIEGGVYLASCEACSWRRRCLGLRQDYLNLHGPGAFAPLP